MTAFHLTAEAGQNTSLELINAIRIEANHFDTNRDRMRFPHFEKKKLFVGLEWLNRMNDCYQFPAQAIRHVLDGARRNRNYRSPLLLTPRAT